MRFNLESKAEDNVIAQGVGSAEAVAKFNESSVEIDALRKEFDEKKRLMVAQFRTDFSNISKAFFEAVPRIKSLTWTQYTPYFMDGDVCEFSVNGVEFATDENEDIESYREFDNEDGNFSAELYSLKKLVTSKEFHLCEKMAAIISDNEELMEDLFGDHVIVVLREIGIVVEEYEHD